MSTPGIEALLKRFKKDENEYKQLNELNSRFVHFLTAVKEQSKKNEYLESCLLQQRETHFQNLRDNNDKYYKSLSESKRMLNELCFHLNIDLVKERHCRILSDWFSKMINFELENSKIKPRSLLNQQQNDNNELKKHNYFLTEFSLINHHHSNHLDTSIQPAYVSSTPDPINSDHALFDQNLSFLSNISVSQSSLISCSSTSFSLTPSCYSSSLSSSGASSACEENNSTTTTQPPPATTTTTMSQKLEPPYASNNSISQGFLSDSSICFSLETYLHTLNRQCGDVRGDYEKKLSECIELRENVGNLTQHLEHLNGNLDSIRVENIALKDSITRLESEIRFLKKINCKKRVDDNNCEIVDREKFSIKESTSEWFRNELEQARCDIENEYENFTVEQLEEYEKTLQNELLDELDRMDAEFNSAADLFDLESNEIIDELIELNGQLSDDFVEYESLQRINYELNTRLVDISSNLTAYSSLSEEEKDLVVVKYTNRSLQTQVATLQANIKDLKKELAQIKEKHIGKSAMSLLIQQQQKINTQPPPPPSLSIAIKKAEKMSERKSAIPIKKSSVTSKEGVAVKSSTTSSVSKLKSNNIFKFNPVLDNKEFLLLDHLKLNQKFQLRSNYAQIEYTKSNLFAYFVIKFDLIFNINSFKHHQTSSSSSSSSSLPPTSSSTSSNSKSILCNLKIINDSFDGHSIIIENSHKILDIDLSDWTLRREIYNSAPFIDKDNIYNEIVSKCSVLTDIDNLAPLNEGNNVDIIEFKFPSNFKLKRRKKINLIAAGPKNSTIDFSLFNDESAYFVKKSTLTSTSLCSLSCNNLSDLNSRYERNKLSSASSTLSLASSGASSTTSMSSVKSKLIASKCACCSCKMLVKRKGDVEFFEIGEIPTWGSGILVITKLVNNKGLVKLINFKFLKHIWVNNCKSK